MRQKITILTAIIVTLATAQIAFADLKVKSRQTVSGQSYESTTYTKGKRQRSEAMNGMTVSITQCDLRRAIQMNPATKTFTVNEWGEIEPAAGAQKVDAKSAASVNGGRVLTTINVKDTGERKQMFGFTARHLIITMEMQSSPDACSKTNTKMQTDGWYIDFEPGFDCDQYNNPGAFNRSSGGCQDKYEIRNTGSGKRGFALYEKMTMFDESGRETMSMVSEVVELSKATLDTALFDVPADYRQVSDSAQMYAASLSGAGSVPSSAAVTGVQQQSGFGANTSEMAQRPAAAAANDLSPAKPAGVIRIGIADVKTGSVGQGVTAADLAAAVENSLIRYLKVPSVELVPLDAKLASAIEAEAKEKQCDLVLYATASHKKGGGGGFGKMFGSAIGTALSHTGIGSTGSVTGNIAGQVAAQTIISATTVSVQMKNKDEMTLEIKLVQLGGAALLAKSFKAKAKSDGDDIISAVIEPAAQAVVDSLPKQ